MGFDLETHKRNSKGQIHHVQEYRLVIEGGTKKYERPVGSGQWFYENNEPVEKPKAEAIAAPVVAVKKG